MFQHYFRKIHTFVETYMATCKKVVSGRSFLLILCLFPLTLFADDPVSGVVVPLYQVELSFATTGRVIELKSIGAMVSKGDIISRLDDRQDKTALKAAEAVVKIAQLALEKAIHDRDKKSRLSSERIISEMAITEADFAVRSAAEELNLSMARLSAAKLTLADCLLTAPYSGVIVDNYLSVSEIVSGGTPVTRLANLNELSLTVDVPYAMSSSLKKGMQSTIESNGEIMGTVRLSTLMPLLDPASGLRRVIWSVEESYVDLLAGRYVTITPW